MTPIELLCTCGSPLTGPLYSTSEVDFTLREMPALGFGTTTFAIYEHEHEFGNRFPRAIAGERGGWFLSGKHVAYTAGLIEKVEYSGEGGTFVTLSCGCGKVVGTVQSSWHYPDLGVLYAGAVERRTIELSARCVLAEPRADRVFVRSGYDVSNEDWEILIGIDRDGFRYLRTGEDVDLEERDIVVGSPGRVSPDGWAVLLDGNRLQRGRCPRRDEVVSFRTYERPAIGDPFWDADVASFDPSERHLAVISNALDGAPRLDCYTRWGALRCSQPLVEPSAVRIDQTERLWILSRNGIEILDASGAKLDTVSLERGIPAGMAISLQFFEVAGSTRAWICLRASSDDYDEAYRPALVLEVTT